MTGTRTFNGEKFRFFSTYSHADAKKKVKDLKREFPSIQARTVKTSRKLGNGKTAYEVYTRRK